MGELDACYFTDVMYAPTTVELMQLSKTKALLGVHHHLSSSIIMLFIIIIILLPRQHLRSDHYSPPQILISSSSAASATTHVHIIILFKMTHVKCPCSRCRHELLVERQTFYLL